MKLEPDDEAKIRELLPTRMVGGLLRYIEEGILPGSFWRAVLENDLKEACMRADDENKYRLYDYVYVLYNYTPAGCWGSPEQVRHWIALFKEAKHETSPSTLS